jgi:hypothetical protein
MARRWTARSIPVVATLLSIALASLASGCADANTTGTGRPQPSSVRTVEQVLDAKDGAGVFVKGALVATGTGVDQNALLASVLLESYPPQAGGATLPLVGLEPGSIVGLSSTAGHPGAPQVTWSDFWLVLRGVMSAGELQVSGVPRVIEAAVGGAKLRFSPVSEPVTKGDTAWWALDLTNRGSAPLLVTFSSGQRVDVVLSRNGIEQYRWSAGKAFDQAIQTITLQPGDILPVVVNDILPVEPGEYDLQATMTGTLDAGGASQPLPALSGTITVY